MSKLTCAIHGCPMIEFKDGSVACWVAYVQQLIGHKVVDIAVDDGVVVWIFDNYMTVPLIGWKGNKKASSDKEEADALLDIMDGATLLEVFWDAEDNQGHLTVGDVETTIEEGEVAEPWWGITLWDSLEDVDMGTII